MDRHFRFNVPSHFLQTDRRVWLRCEAGVWELGELKRFLDLYSLWLAKGRLLGTLGVEPRAGQDNSSLVIKLEVDAIDSVHATLKLDNEIAILPRIHYSHFHPVLYFYLKPVPLAGAICLHRQVDPVKLRLDRDTLESLAQVWAEVKLEIL